MYLNQFSEDQSPLDMTALAEFESLKQSARDLGIIAAVNPRYHSRNVVIRRQRFHFLEWGDSSNPPLVLLHGSNQSAHSWDLVSLNLAASYHVFALDQRGHGDSEWSRGAHYSVEEMALDLEAFIMSQGINCPIVVGHSMGGMVTMAFARSNPDSLAGMVIVDIGPEVNAEGTKMIREFVGRNIEFDDMDEFLDRVVKYDPYRSREHIERTLKYNLMKRADGRYVTKHDRRRFLPADDGNRTSIAGAPTLEELSRLDIATLIVRGGDSKVLVEESAVRFVDKMLRGQLVTVQECGHNVASQNTVGFLSALKPFLDSLPR